MNGLQLKYFILKPKSKYPRDPHANASRKAMLTYANEIREFDYELADDLIEWVSKEND